MTAIPPMAPFTVTNRALLSIALPMTLAYLTTPLVGVVSLGVIGQLGDPALVGGVSIGGLVFDVVFMTFGFLRAGTTGLVAQTLGAGDRREIAAVLARAGLLALAVGVGIVVVEVPALAAVEQLAGRALGARDRIAFERAFRLTIFWGFAVGLLVSGVFFAAGGAVIDLMTTSAAVRATARGFLWLAALFPLVGTLAYQMDGLFIGATWSTDLRNMMLVSVGAYLVAAWPLERVYGITGVGLATGFPCCPRRDPGLARLRPHRARLRRAAVAGRLPRRGLAQSACLAVRVPQGPINANK